MLFSNLSQVSLAQAADGASSLASLLPIILMFVVLYFLMIRPQMKRQKEHRAMVAALAVGDEVITAGGLLGKITSVTDNYVTVELSAKEGHSYEALLQRVAVTGLLPKGTIKAL